MKTNNKRLNKIAIVSILGLVASLHAAPVLAKGHMKQAGKVLKCDAKKHQKLKISKDKKSGKMIKHCVYVGKTVKKSWRPRLTGKAKPKSSCVGMAKTKKQACLKEEAKKRQAMQKSATKMKGTTSKRSSFFAGTPKQKGAYIGASFGQSTLKPNVNTVGGSVTDSSDMAYKVFAGYKINRKFAVEGFYAEMGDAEVDTGSKVGDINYRLAGASGLYTHQFKSRFSGFAKVGAAKLGNKSTNGISFKKVKDYSINMGAGLKYDINRRLSLRGEYEIFDKDIKLLSTGLMVNF